LIEHAQKLKRQPGDLAYDSLEPSDSAAEGQLGLTEPLFEQLLSNLSRSALKKFQLGEAIVHSDDEDLNPDVEGS
jgi:hypothetical protein